VGVDDEPLEDRRHLVDERVLDDADALVVAVVNGYAVRQRDGGDGQPEVAGLHRSLR